MNQDKKDLPVPPQGTPQAGMPPAGTPPAGTPPAGMPHAGMPHAGMPRKGLSIEELLPVDEEVMKALKAGFRVEFDPDEAERLGAFEEDALSEKDAWESRKQLKDANF